MGKHINITNIQRWALQLEFCYSAGTTGTGLSENLAEKPTSSLDLWKFVITKFVITKFVLKKLLSLKSVI